MCNSQVQAPGIDLLFYGDSLTDLWRGTVWGYSSHLGPGIPAVFSRYFGQYNSAICGAGGEHRPAPLSSHRGDVTPRCLLWRGAGMRVR